MCVRARARVYKREKENECEGDVMALGPTLHHRPSVDVCAERVYK